jgi:hypothetical protein
MTGWRWIVGVVLLVHGVGHVLGVIPLFREELVSGWNLRSWLPTGLVGQSSARFIAAALFTAATIVFVLSGLAVLGWGVPEDWWMTLAVVGAVGSTLSLALFWNAFPALVPNKVGALAVNIIILGNWVNVWDWPSDEMLGEIPGGG